MYFCELLRLCICPEQECCVVVGSDSNWGWLQFWASMNFVAYGFGEYIYPSVWVNFKINHRAVCVEIYGPEFDFPIRVNEECWWFVRAQEEFWLIWFWVSVYFYMPHWFSWVTTTDKVSFAVAFCASLMVYWWELAHNLQEWKWNCLLCCLSCLLRLAWECIPCLIFCLNFMNEISISRVSEVASSLACLFVSLTARPAFLSIKSGFLSERSVRVKS